MSYALVPKDRLIADYRTHVETRGLDPCTVRQYCIRLRYNRMCILRLFSAFHHLQWPETISAITSYLKLRSQTTAPPENALFLNNQKQRLTRFGVRDII